MNKKIFFISIITISFWFLIDFIFGEKILKLTQAEWWRVPSNHNYSQLASSIEINDIWGTKRYILCTDKSGFKTSCKNKNKLKKNYELGIIGDSNIEAVGVNYENSLAGLIEKYKNFDVANLAVQSYSPIIYLKKIKTLLNNGYKFNHIIVFIDPSDFVDEADYQLVNDKIFLGKNDKIQKVKKIVRNIFPFTYKITWYVKKFYLTDETNLKNCEIREKCNSRWSWSIKDHGNLGRLKLSINEASYKLISNLEELNLLLKKNEIKFSVGIYPYPSHFKYDNANSKYKQIIESFCVKKNNCDSFFDLYTPLFQMYEVNKTLINEIYFKKDIHFNKSGNKLLFEILKSKYDGEF